MECPPKQAGVKDVPGEEGLGKDEGPLFSSAVWMSHCASWKHTCQVDFPVPGRLVKAGVCRHPGARILD